MKPVKTKAEAMENAVALVSRMKGSGWRPVVFENMGWYWRAVSGPVQVYPSDDGKFWAMIGSKPKDNVGGLAAWTPQRIANRRDPNRAVREALRVMEDVVAGYEETRRAARTAAGVVYKRATTR